MCLLMACVGEVEARERARHAPPEAVICERNQLTSYHGELSAYRAEQAGIHFEIATEWGTVENLVIPVNDPARPDTAFLLEGAPFGSSDWDAIASEPGSRTPRPGIGLIAWVCLDDETATMIDWRP